MPEKVSPRVLVAIVNKNGHPHLNDCVKSLLETDYTNFNVVLFDNGSTDRSFQAVKEMLQQKDHFLLVKSRNPISLTRALNLAIGLASRGAKYLALLDSDVVVRRDWLIRLIEVMESDETIGSCQSLLLLASSTDRIDGTGDFVDFLGNAISRNSNEKVFELTQLTNEIFSARSAAMIMRRDLFWRLGGMDESLEINYEDVDLGWRIRLAGFSNRFIPDSVVFHRAGSSTSALTRSHVTYQGTKNRLRMLLKNYELPNLVKYAPLRLTLDLFGCVLLFFAGRQDVSMAVLQGLVWNLTNLRNTMKARAFVQTRIRVVSDSCLVGKYISRRMIVPPLRAWRILSKHAETSPQI